MKLTTGDLAIFGGVHAFLRPLYVGSPNTVDRDRLFDRLNWALDNQWLSNSGPLAVEFEARTAELAGVRNSVATCNATVALQMLCHALELSGEVIMPSLTFAATAHAARWVGLDPVFVDVDPQTGQLDPALAAEAVGPLTSAILGVHLWGRTCPAPELEKVAADHGLPLFFDAAHAIGCTLDGRPVASFGNASVFSFHPTKVVAGFEGGAIVTDDDALAGRLRSLRNFGMGPGAGSPAGGTNGKMSEAAAAMALTSLDGFERAVAHNRSNFDAYAAGLDAIPGVRLMPHDPSESRNYQYVIIEIDESVAGVDRDLVLEILQAEHIMAKPYFSPACHELEPYRSGRTFRLPHTERLARRVLALPTGSAVSRESIRRICDVLRLVVSRSDEVTSRWQQMKGRPT
ncbi:aminotransferase class I/II-fold pyridoxal phosphate-dependent enzyme [Streptomyces atratus]|uniref:aminotransferase class I/II-fold pyridoxal phosphate-dependent enzyme n=1 Tax=Streptomyces atratus TaxID=1893 RepID=UPI0022571F81|nr:aminotransferase class I/II-fold pyridoxal phosphate-dependent enzyme [Streptomyces atratus]MCX5340131.1 aminotransferase class I/II-fold pyridoxal phosphate-dependent enzyme [Streptomyces atratus]